MNAIGYVQNGIQNFMQTTSNLSPWYVFRHAARTDSPDVALKWLEEAVIQAAAAPLGSQNDTSVNGVQSPHIEQVNMYVRMYVPV